jgi:hypothetical protein
MASTVASEDNGNLKDQDLTVTSRRSKPPWNTRRPSSVNEVNRANQLFEDEMQWRATLQSLGWKGAAYFVLDISNA